MGFAEDVAAWAAEQNLPTPVKYADMPFTTPDIVVETLPATTALPPGGATIPTSNSWMPQGFEGTVVGNTVFPVDFQAMDFAKYGQSADQAYVAQTYGMPTYLGAQISGTLDPNQPLILYKGSTTLPQQTPNAIPVPTQPPVVPPTNPLVQGNSLGIENFSFLGFTGITAFLLLYLLLKKGGN